ncbi:hypothetical protein ACFV0T_13915 [Streptomyces sp. NPDC059582]|uniref:hypothetical protein n=1 Tax=Streptomyces sp. NPDC059582 TaxID=3346875 RepID=UPI003676BAB6
MSERTPPARTRAGLTTACLALLLPVAACTSGATHAEQSARPTDAEQSARPTHSAEAEGARSENTPSVEQPPELDTGVTLAARQGATSGSAHIPFREGAKGDALIVAVRCQGPGKVAVMVDSVDIFFRQDCPAHTVGTIYNQVALTGVDRGGTVSVTAPSGVRWSLTVGRGEPVEADPPTAGG